MSNLSQYIPYYKRNFKVAAPIMIAQAGQMSVQLIDSIMVGHVGTEELAAAAFSGSVFVIGYVFGMGFTFGITPLVGQAFGNDDSRRVGGLLRDSFVLNSLMTLVLGLFLFLVSYAMPYFGQPPEVVELAIPYYRILVYSLLPLLMFYTFKQFLEGIGKTKVATLSTLSVNVLNVILNYLLIYGTFGFPELGLNGAGLATFISRLLMPVLIIAWFIRSEHYVKYKDEFKLKLLELRKLLELFKFSIPIGLQIIVEVIAFALGGIMMGWLGAVPLAAHQIALGIASFTFMIASGIGSATTIRVSYQLGAKQYKELKLAGLSSIHLILVFMTLTAIVFFFANELLPVLFTKDTAVIALAAKLLLFAAVFQIVDGIQLVSISALRGLSDVKFPLWFSILSYGFLALGSSYAFAFTFDFGPSGIWIGYVVGLTFASIIFFLRFLHLTKALINKNKD